MSRPYYVVLAEGADEIDVCEWVLAWSMEEVKRHASSLRDKGYVVHVHEIMGRVKA